MGDGRPSGALRSGRGVCQADRYGVRPREHAVCVSHLSAWDEEPWAACVFGENLSLTRYKDKSGNYSYEAFDFVLDPNETVSVASSSSYLSELSELEAVLDIHFSELIAPAYTPIKKAA